MVADCLVSVGKRVGTDLWLPSLVLGLRLPVATLAEDPEAAAPRLSAEGSASLKTRDAGAAADLGDDQAVTIEQKLKLGVASSTKALPVEPKRWTDPRRTEGSAASHASQV